MRRRLLNLVVALSLLLCGATVALWVHNYRSVSPAGPAQPSSAAIQARLNRPMPRIRGSGADFSQVELGDALAFMRDISGVWIDVNWNALREAGVTPDTTVNLNFPNARMGEALAALLATNGGVVMVTRGNELYVTSRSLHDRDPLFKGIPSGAPPAPDPRVRERVIGRHRWSVAADKGALRVWRTPADPASVYQPPVTSPPQNVSRDTYGLGGFTFERTGYPLNTVQAAVPLWAATLVTALPPLLWLTAAIRRARRKPPGHCRRCGYDLRATPERCPECGTIAAAMAPT
jgi:hypothetical protein